MNGKSAEPSVSDLLVMDGCKLTDELPAVPAVPAAETGACITELLARHGANALILINGAPIDAQAMIRAQVAALWVPSRPPVEVLAVSYHLLETARAELATASSRASRASA